jgi:hypothetical protein
VANALYHSLLSRYNADWRPQQYTNDFLGTCVRFDFRTVKLLDYRDELEVLERSANPFARFVVAHLKTLATQGDYETRLAWKLRLIQGLYDMGVADDEIGQLCHDFDWLLALPEPLALRFHRSMTRFEEEKEMPHLSTAERIGRKIGRQEGREEGRQEGRRDLVLDQLSVKFGPLSAEIVTRVKGLSTAELERVGRAILTAQSIEDLHL